MLNKTSKEYKRVINFHISKYKHSNANKRRHMSSNRPKHYWKLLNKLKPKSRDNNNYPSLHDFYEYYKNINGLDTGESQSSGTPLNADVNHELNMPISPPEISLNIFILHRLRNKFLQLILISLDSASWELHQYSRRMCGPMKNPKVEIHFRDSNSGPHDCSTSRPRTPQETARD